MRDRALQRARPGVDIVDIVEKLGELDLMDFAIAEFTDGIADTGSPAFFVSEREQ